MKQQRPHRENITRHGRARDVAVKWDITNLFSGKNPSEMTAGDQAKSTSVTVGYIEMDTKSDELSERKGVRLCIGDSISDAAVSR